MNKIAGANNGRTEIRVTGFGGQGVILSGYIIGKAAALFASKHATMTQSFGPEARGSACSAQVVVSEERILYPYVRRPHILIAMSQEGFVKSEPSVSENGLVLIEQDLVKPGILHGERTLHSIPAIRFAEELGRRLVLNIVMTGFYAALARVPEGDAVRKAVETSVPKGTEELNLKAFDKGYEYGLGLSGES